MATRRQLVKVASAERRTPDLVEVRAILGSRLDGLHRSAHAQAVIRRYVEALARDEAGRSPIRRRIGVVRTSGKPFRRLG